MGSKVHSWQPRSHKFEAIAEILMAWPFVSNKPVNSAKIPGHKDKKKKEGCNKDSLPLPQLFD